MREHCHRHPCDEPDVKERNRCAASCDLPMLKRIDAWSSCLRSAGEFPTMPLWRPYQWAEVPSREAGLPAVSPAGHVGA